MTQKSYCNNCGSSNTLEDSFCSECGAPLNQGKPTTGEAKTITNRRVNHSKPIKKNHWKYLCWSFSGCWGSYSSRNLS